MAREMEEKRRFMRVPFNTEVEIQANDHTIRSTKGINISLSGLRMSIEQDAPPVGASCQVKITLSMSEHRVAIDAKGNVIRSDPRHVAIRFTELDLDSYHHLRQLIINNAEDPEQAEREFSAHWGIRQPAPSDRRH
jgi:hypothetical protein